MKKIGGRISAEVDGDVVVFLIGMHVNRWHDVRRWWPTVRAMTRMLRELRAHPELGLLRVEGGWLFGGPATVQYWRSYEHLESYARAADSAHLPAWRAFNRAARESDSVGIWHETYRVTPGNVESVYHHMPPVGLVAAGRPVPLHRGSTSAQRIGARVQDTAPVPAPD